MSKPLVAAEPTLEEILASIRKMITDDKVGPVPVPDQMGRTPFGESLHAAGGAGTDVRGEPSQAAPATSKATASFNSLADALKVATALSDQRRVAQQDSAEVIETRPRSNLDVLTELSGGRFEASRPKTEGRSAAPFELEARLDPIGSVAKGSPVYGPAGGEGKRDLLSFDFGTVVPQREEAQKMALPAEMRVTLTPASDSEPLITEGLVEKVEAKLEEAAENRVLPLRAGLNGNALASNALGFNVAPFPRPMREVPKPVELEIAKPAVTAGEDAAGAKVESDVAASSDMVDLQPSDPLASMQPVAEAADKEVPVGETVESVADVISGAVAGAISDTVAGAPSLASEALLDAVVELVQREPDSLSVFASGSSFISGVGEKKPEGTSLVVATEEVSEVMDAEHGGGVQQGPKIDRAAAELLRPMLRQWLAENMGRILEEALRSELSEQTQGSKPLKLS